MNETMQGVLTAEHAGIRKNIYFAVKRLFDIFVGLVGTILLLPIALVIKIAYLIDGDKAPIFYKQKRIGLNGKTIYIYKFRSMVPNAEEILAEWLKNNPDKRDEYLKTRKI